MPAQGNACAISTHDPGQMCAGNRDASTQKRRKNSLPFMETTRKWRTTAILSFGVGRPWLRDNQEHRPGTHFVLSWRMSTDLPQRRQYVRLSTQDRDAIIGDYELGLASGRELARRYGIHPNTLSRMVKSRGTVKGSRAMETVVDLIARLDERDRIAAHRKMLDDIKKLDQFNAGADMIGQFMAAFVQADRDGRLVEFGRAAGLGGRQPLGIRRRSHTRA